MSANQNQGSYNRSSRGGRRRRGGNRPSNSSYRPGDRRPAQQKIKKKSLWQKILSFFTGDKPASVTKSSPAAPAPARKTSAPASQQSARTSSIRKPEAIEVTTPRVYVGNLSFDATESDLQELFSGVGSVANVEIVFNKHTHRSKGFAFIQMQSIDEAKRAVEELHDKEYMGRKLVVSGAKAVQESRRSSQSEEEESSEEQQPPSAA